MLYHLAHRDDWNSALVSGEYRVSTRGRSLDDVGFIHASTADQLPRVAEAFYADDPAELVVLFLDDNAIARSGTEIRLEDAGAGELFPHVYGPILPAFVTTVTPAGFTDGRFLFRPLA